MSTQHHDHAHDHPHEHAHDHTHDHHHDGDTFYLDQICMVGISGAFGAICLALYFSNLTTPADSQSMLRLLLGPQFHFFVLASGIALVVIAGIRGVTLWRLAGRPARAHDHVHDHDHDHADCQHDHAACDHDHAHDHGHDHDHAHAHGHHHHHHGHDHGPEDHDHGWAPWRYVLLLVPIILFLLGLPNKGPQAAAQHVELDMKQVAAAYAGLVASAPANAEQSLTWIAAMHFSQGEVTDVIYKDLETFATTAERRAEMKNRMIRVRGQFAPSPGSDHVFSLVRYRIQCCAADAIPLRVPMFTQESLAGAKLPANTWVKVTGVVDFQEMGGRHVTILKVPNLRSIETCPPDNNPYIQ